MKNFLLFLIIFDPQIPYFISGVGFTAIVFPGLIAAFLIKSKGRIPRISTLSHAKPFAALHFLLLLLSLIVLLMASDNFDYLFGVAKAIIVFCAIVSYLLFYKPTFNDKFFAGLLFIYCVNAAINFSAGTFPEYFSWTEVFRAPVISDALGTNPYRNNFISGSGYYSIGTAYGLFCLFYIYFGSGRKNNFLSSVGLILTSVAGFVGARTSMFAIGAGVAYLLRKFQIIKIIILTIVGALFAYFILDDNGILGPYKIWLLGFFDGKEDASAEYLLKEMFFWPGENIFFLGSGFVNDGNFTYTDSGFMQDILFGGIFYAFLKFAFPLYFAFRFFKREPVFVLLFLGVAVAFQIKGAFFVSNAQGMAIFYLMYFFFCDKYAFASKNAKYRILSGMKIKSS